MFDGMTVSEERYPGDQGPSTMGETRRWPKRGGFAVGAGASAVVVGGCTLILVDRVSSGGCPDLLDLTLASAVALAAAGLFVSVLLPLVDGWRSRRPSVSFRAFRLRDRRGARLPGRSLTEQLDQTPNLGSLLGEQPDDVLEAMRASGWGGGDAAASPVGPACTPLTLVDYALGPNAQWRSAALRLMPNDLWRSAARTLLSSRHSETRLAAVNCASLTHGDLLRACGEDETRDVREAAWQRLSGRLSARDHMRLLASRHPNVRRHVVEADALSLRRLARVCARDTDESVRLAAWNALSPGMTARMARWLCRSRRADVRVLCIGSDLLPRARLVDLCANDREQSVRQTAWDHIPRDLTEDECWTLACSRHSDTRLALADHQNTPRPVLTTLSGDRDSRVRHRALARLHANATPRELDRLSESPDATTRAVAAASPQLRRRTLMRLAVDPDATVRHVALPLALQNASFAEIASLLRAASSEGTTQGQTSSVYGRGCAYQEVYNAAIGTLRANLGRPGAEVVLPHILERETQREVVESVLGLEGVGATPKIAELLGANRALQHIGAQRLAQFVRDTTAEEAAKLLSGIVVVDRNVRVGTVRVEREEPDYDSYGSYTGTYTVTETRDRTLPYTCFDPRLVDMVLLAVRPLSEGKRRRVMSLLSAQSPALADPVRAGLAGEDWRGRTFDGLLRQVRSIRDEAFTPFSDDEITQQLSEPGWPAA